MNSDKKSGPADEAGPKADDTPILPYFGATLKELIGSIANLRDQSTEGELEDEDEGEPRFWWQKE